MATISELIQTAQDKLAVVLEADPAAYVDYRIADKSVSKSQYVEHLLETIKKLTATVVPSEVDIEFVQFDFDIDAMGADQTQRTVL
jgi:hypothetical protein